MVILQKKFHRLINDNIEMIPIIKMVFIYIFKRNDSFLVCMIFLLYIQSNLIQGFIMCLLDF